MLSCFYKKEVKMSIFVYILGLLMAWVGIAMVANSFKPPFGPLGVLLIVVGVFICIKKLKKFYRRRDEKKGERFN